jgi:hypothetical protein
LDHNQELRFFLNARCADSLVDGGTWAADPPSALTSLTTMAR